jgi:hypothetical protein
MQTKSLSTAVRVGRTVGVLVAIAIWETFARRLFSSPPGGVLMSFSFSVPVLWAVPGRGRRFHRQRGLQ